MALAKHEDMLGNSGRRVPTKRSAKAFMFGVRTGV